MKIHQIWLGGAIPAHHQSWRTAWRQLNPEAAFYLWTDSGTPQLQNQAVYDACQILSGRKNIAAWEILRQYGGVMLDCDIEPLRPIANLPDAWVCDLYPNFACVAAMSFPARHPLLEAAIAAIPTRGGHPVVQSGSVLLNELLRDFPDVVRVPASAFFPWTPNDRQRGIGVHEVDTSLSYGIHHFEGNRRKVGE